jgi:hypothetical protein
MPVFLLNKVNLLVRGYQITVYKNGGRFSHDSSEYVKNVPLL